MNFFLHDPARRQLALRPKESRQRLNQGFLYFCIGTASLSIIVLAVLLGSILLQGLRFLSLRILCRLPGNTAATSGIAPAVMGTVWVCALCALFTLPLGVATAILLEEFAPRNRLVR